METKVIKKWGVKIAFAIEGICFLLPILVQRNFHERDEKLVDGIIFWGYQNLYFYLNLGIISFAYLIGKKNIFFFVTFYILLILNLLIQFVVFDIIKSIPFGNSSSPPNIEIGYYLFLITTVFLSFYWMKNSPRKTRKHVIPSPHERQNS